MCFLQKIKFWRKRNSTVSPTMVDASVSTEGPRTRDVATITEFAVQVGWCELYSYEGTSNGIPRMLPIVRIRRTCTWMVLRDTHRPFVETHLPLLFQNGPFQGHQSIIKGVILSLNASTLHSNQKHFSLAYIFSYNLSSLRSKYYRLTLLEM